MKGPCSLGEGAMVLNAFRKITLAVYLGSGFEG